MTQAYEEGDIDRLARVAEAALERYGQPPSTSLTLVNLSENATYLARAPDARDPTVLRVHRPGYNSPTEIASELAWIDALRQQAGLRTPRVVPATDGARVTLVETTDWPSARACVMFRFCPGQEPAESEMVPGFERLGAIAARMHKHARSWTRPRWFTRRRWDFHTAIGTAPHWGRWEDGMGIGPEELALLGRLRDALERRLGAYGTGPERFGLVHADMRLANLLFDGPDTYVIDFDDCGISWYLYDLATSFTFIEDRADVAELIDAWLRGYRGVHPLAAEDVALIPTLMMLRRLLVVAWIGSHANTDLARIEGIPYTQTTCRLAEGYLGGSLGWA